MLNNAFPVTAITDAMVSFAQSQQTPATNNMDHANQVELFNSLVDNQAHPNITIKPTHTPPVAQSSAIRGDHHITSLLKKMDKWRSYNNSHLTNITNNMKNNPLNAASMMKIQLDLLKFSLGYEMTSKLVGKGISAIDTLLRSQ